MTLLAAAILLVGGVVWLGCLASNTCVLALRLVGHSQPGGLQLLGILAGIMASFAMHLLDRFSPAYIALAFLPDLVLFVAEIWFRIRLHVLKLPDKSASEGS